MRVGLVTRFGGPEVLVTSEVPDPVPGPGEVVVAVAAADVLWIETAIRQGMAGEHFDVRPPYVPGNAVAGRITAVGAAVDHDWIGRDVVSYTPNGGYAERVAVPAAGLTPVPDGVDLPVAAALAHDGVSAVALFEVTRIGRGDAVLVVGASGGLGILSVQVGLARGARVVATARDDRKLSRVRELGAHAVIDSDSPGWVGRARDALGSAGADLVLDNIGGQLGKDAFELVAPGGRFSAHGTPSGEFTPIDEAEAVRRGVTVSGIDDVQLDETDRKRLLKQALVEAAAGRLRPVIGQTFPLSRAADAHVAIENRSVFGKTLLLP